MDRPRRLTRMAALTGLLFAIIAMAAQSGPWVGGTTTYARSPINNQEVQNSGIAFTNPDALRVTVGEGDDFATRVLGDAWDMNSVRDIGFEIGFVNISANNGIWTGTYSGQDQASVTNTAGYLFPLFQGFSTPVTGGLSQELAFNKIGAEDRFAVNTSKYTRLSYRMSVSPRSATSPFFVQWTHAKPVNWPLGENRFGRLDACQGATQFFAWNGWHTYNFDMTQQNGDDAVRAGAWQSAPLVRGLRIDPSATGAAGTQVKIDWIRLSDPASAPTIAIPWNAPSAAASDTVDIFVADNPGGVDASPIAYGLPANAGVYNLPTSILPPGQHYFQLRLKNGAIERGCTTTKGESDWIGPLTITPLPIVTFARPSMTSGPDYATTELGRPWDMSSSADIVTPGSPYPQTIADSSYNNGIFSARAVLNPGQIESDSQIWLRVDPSRPINTNRYRYFTIRLKVDMPPGKDLNWAIAYGWGGRIIWWNDGINIDGSESKYGTYYAGWRNYSIDLARAFPPPPVSNPLQADNILTPREQNSFPAQRGWTQLGTVRNLRFDPLETMQQAVGTGADIFSIDWVRLTANDEIKRGQVFPVEVGVNLDPAALRSITFYYTTNPAQPTQNQAVPYAPPAPAPVTGDYKIYLPTVARFGSNGAPGNPLSFNWDTTSVTRGTYFVCATADTGRNAATYCSETPVVVLP